MKFRTYNMIKNVFVGSAAATFYNGYVVENASLAAELFGTLAVFGLVVVLLRDADKAFIRSRKAKREVQKTEEVTENKKSA